MSRADPDPECDGNHGSKAGGGGHSFAAFFADRRVPRCHLHTWPDGGAEEGTAQGVR